MDINLLLFSTVFVLFLGIMTIAIQKERGALVGFLGGIIGMFFMAQLDNDGAIQGLAQGAPTGIFPYFYLLLFPTIFCFAMALWEGTR